MFIYVGSSNIQTISRQYNCSLHLQPYYDQTSKFTGENDIYLTFPSFESGSVKFRSGVV